MGIKHILFDLDGTLLPMNQEKFVKFYMPLLAKAYIESGIKTEPKAFLGAVWEGLEAMVKNDGSKTNREVFWEYMDRLPGMGREAAEKIATDFYKGAFNEAICATSPNPLADKVVKAAKDKGMDIYLATNPVFPRCATLNRIKWAGLDAEDFKWITTYENCGYCKPNLKYFEQILSRFHLNPSECLMVGNDVAEDLIIRKLGVKTYFLTDTPENKKNLPIETDYQGSMKELLEFIEKLS